jgi:hypothetical protein
LGPILAVCAFLIALPALAQEPPPQTPPPAQAALEAMSSDTDPTKPVLFSLRDEFYDFRGPAWRNVFILRADKLILENQPLPLKTRGVILRADIPLVTHDTGQDSETGLGDVYGQALFIARPKPTFFFAVGSGLTLPAATDDSLGQGKWIVGPLFAPIWYFPKKGFVFVKIQDFISFAGESDRPDVHYLLVTPTFLWRLSPRWWTLLDAESNTNWERDEATWFKAGFLIGRMISARQGMSLKVEVPFGGDRPFDVIVKAVFFRTRF